MKKHNFNAGPSILPREVIEKAAAAVLDFDGLGLSILEISHRSKEFDAVMDDAVALTEKFLLYNFFFSLCCQIFVFMYDLFFYYVDY